MSVGNTSIQGEVGQLQEAEVGGRTQRWRSFSMDCPEVSGNDGDDQLGRKRGPGFLGKDQAAVVSNAGCMTVIGGCGVS